MKQDEYEAFLRLSRVAQISIEEVEEKVNECGLSANSIADFYLALLRFPTHAESELIKIIGVRGITNVLTINQKINETIIQSNTR